MTIHAFVSDKVIFHGVASSQSPGKSGMNAICSSIGTAACPNTLMGNNQKKVIFTARQQQHNLQHTSSLLIYQPARTAQ
jgi:hypothetical protein